MAKLKWRLKSIGPVLKADSGDIVITGDEKLRGFVGVVIPASEVEWLIESLLDIQKGVVDVHLPEG